MEWVPAWMAPRPCGSHPANQGGAILMTSRSTLSICAGLAAVSAVVAGLWASHGLRSGADREKQPSFAAQLGKQQRSPTGPEGQSIRTVYPGPLSEPAQRISPPPQNEMTA